jgi:hypothetical protein
MLPTADDMADSAFEAVGQKKLKELGVGSGVRPDVGARYAKNAQVMDAAYPLPKKQTANDVIPDLPEPTTGVKTVRPGRKGKLPPPPKLPSETGKRVPLDAEQLPVQFPEEPKRGVHWLENELNQPLKVEPVKKGGINASYKVDFPEGRSAIYKPESGAVPMTEVGVSKASVPDRERAMSDAGEVFFGDQSPVPKTVVKDLPGRGRGSLQEFKPNAISADDFEKPAVSNATTAQGEDLGIEPDYQSAFGPARDAEIAARAADPSHQRTFVLDSTLNNVDRHAGNLLLAEGGAGPAVAIDNGLAMADQPKFSFVDRAQPFYNQEYRAGVSKLQPEVEKAARDVSLKKLSEALGKAKTVKPTQVRDTLARARDLSYDPQKLAGKSAGEVDAWVKPDIEKRGMSGPDLNEIDRLTGVDPAARYVGKGVKPLDGVKPLEGEQLSLSDMLAQLRGEK